MATTACSSWGEGGTPAPSALAWASPRSKPTPTTMAGSTTSPTARLPPRCSARSSRSMAATLSPLRPGKQAWRSTNPPGSSWAIPGSLRRLSTSSRSMRHVEARRHPPVRVPTGNVRCPAVRGLTDAPYRPARRLGGSGVGKRGGNADYRKSFTPTGDIWLASSIRPQQYSWVMDLDPFTGGDPHNDTPGQKGKPRPRSAQRPGRTTARTTRVIVGFRARQTSPSPRCCARRARENQFTRPLELWPFAGRYLPPSPRGHPFRPA